MSLTTTAIGASSFLLTKLLRYELSHISLAHIYIVDLLVRLLEGVAHRILRRIRILCPVLSQLNLVEFKLPLQLLAVSLYRINLTDLSIRTFILSGYLTLFMLREDAVQVLELELSLLPVDFAQCLLAVKLVNARLSVDWVD